MPTGLGDEKLWLCPSLDDSADDISGNGNHGTYNGGMGTVADTTSGGSRAYDFDGVDDYIQMYDSGVSGSGGWANFIAQGTFSVAMWYQVDPYIGGVNGAPFWGTRSRGGYYGYWGSAQPISNNNNWHYRFSSTDNFNEYYDASSSSTSDTNWHHICWSVTSNTSQLFIDGTLDSSLTPSTSPSQSIQTSLYFGRLKNWIYLNGRLDDIRIFDRALGSSEITHLASARGVQGSPYTSTGLGDEKLWLCPSLDDSADDISGNGNHGTYNGGMGTVADTDAGGSKSYSFDGIDDRIALSSSTANPLFCGTNSVALWMRIEGNTFTADGNTTLVGHDSTATTWYNFTYINNGGLRSFADNGSANGIADASSAQAGGTFEDDVWRHVVCVRDYDNQQVRFYVDGTEVASVSSTVTAPSSISDNPFVGYSSLYGYASGYNGGVYIRYDDIRIFDRALSDREITHLATSRGIEGNPYQYNGLGDEKLWLCPSLNDSADDLSGNGNHGTYNGGMGTVLDDSEGGIKAYSFDGTDDVLRVASDLTFTDDFSITAYVRSDSPSVLAGIAGNLLESSPYPQNYFLYQYQGNWKGNVKFSGSSWTTVTGPSIVSGQWVHLALVRSSSSSNIRLYVDGSLYDTTSSSGSVVSTPQMYFSVGARATSSSASDAFLNGRCDDIRVFDRALTTSEITALASKRGYRSLTGPHPHPLTVSIEHPLG